jgi:hypothetical protein
MPRRAALLCVILALAVAPAAHAQSNPFAPLPQAVPTATPTPAPTTSNTTDNGNTGRTTLLLIGAALLVAFAAMGIFIARDARRSLPEDKRPTDARRDEMAHRRKREAKSRARAKGRAQKHARRRNRAA